MKKTIALTFAVLFMVSCTSSQKASYFFTQKQIAEGDLDFESRLRISEYINAFPQDELAKPKAKEDVAISVDFFQTDVPRANPTSIAQVALKTREGNTKEREQKLAISLVVDVSGSMADDRKFEDMMQALDAMMAELPSGTELAVTEFNDQVAQRINPTEISAENREILRRTLRDKMRAGGGTNIEGGLIAGYKALSAFKPTSVARLILITDGQSTVGTHNPRDIAARAGTRVIENARITTIGLGHDVDETLLRGIAENGKGHYYFADKGATLTRYLREELRSLMQPVMKDVVVEIAARKNFNIRRIYGYPDLERNKDGRYVIQMGELNVEDFRVLILEFEGDDRVHGSVEPIEARVSYTSVANGKPRQQTAPTAKVNFDSKVERSKVNKAVARNAIVFADAISLIESSKLFKKGSYAEADRILAIQLTNLEVAKTWDKTGAINREIETLKGARSIVQRRLPRGLAEPTEEAKSMISTATLIKTALGLVGQTLPGPWSVILGLLSTAIPD